MGKVDGFDELTGGQLKALCIKLGGVDVVNAILRGEMSVEVKECVRRLVDKNGRMIPPTGMKSAVCDPDTKFRLIQPEINYAERLSRLVRFFPGLTFVSAEKFQKRSEELLEQIGEDPSFGNLLKGAWLPVCYPRFKLSDYGGDLENIFLKAVGDSYEDQFLAQKREFYNYRKGELKGQVEIVDESHKRLIARMAEDSVVGLQFFPLQGFSINADRELAASLPTPLLLSGPIDIATAMTAYPDVLARDYETPKLDCSAVSWRSAGFSLFFSANDGWLKFSFTDNLGLANVPSSGGLVFLG